MEKGTDLMSAHLYDPGILGFMVATYSGLDKTQERGEEKKMQAVRQLAAESGEKAPSRGNGVRSTKGWNRRLTHPQGTQRPPNPAWKSSCSWNLAIRDQLSLQDKAE